MARIDGVFKKYENVTASTTVDLDIVIDADKSWNILGVSMTAPGDKKTRVFLMWNAEGPGSAMNKIYEACTHDKFSEPRNLYFDGNGTKILRIRLVNNDTVANFMGCTVYYEEMG